MSPGSESPILLHLLGPNYRPVQETEDLASFLGHHLLSGPQRPCEARYPKAFLAR